MTLFIVVCWLVGKCMKTLLVLTITYLHEYFSGFFLKKRKRITRQNEQEKKSQGILSRSKYQMKFDLFNYKVNKF